MTTEIQVLRRDIEQLKSAFYLQAIGADWSELRCARFLREADLHYPRPGEEVTPLSLEKARQWVAQFAEGVGHE